MGNETKHTPGPWRVTPYQTKGNGMRYDVITIVDKRVVTLAANQNEANARLIAAAPELLAALQRLVYEWNLGRTPIAQDWSRARAAIAKAEGKE